MTFFQTDLIRVSAGMSFAVGGQDLINVMHLELLSPASLTDVQAVADVGEVLENYYAGLVASQNTNIQYIDYAVKNETQDLAPLVSSWPTLTVGGSATEAIAPQLAALLIMRTAQSRKSGRVFLGGFVETSLTSSVWSAGFLTTMGIFITALLTTQVATNGNWRYSVATPGTGPPPTAALALDAPISGKAIGNVRTQRRRSVAFGS